MIQKILLYSITFCLAILVHACRNVQEVELEKYGLPAKINCPGSCEVHHLDLIVAGEISIGKGQSTIQILWIPVENADVNNIIQRQMDAVYTESGFDELVEQTDSYCLYSYYHEGHRYFQFKVLSHNKEYFVQLRAHPRNKLNLQDCKKLMQVASSLKWYG